eukprot:CAMPEP_0172487484 /NCGR_PEP_ID=MMETSP1066-20121228/16600_1 /TAXON_ID=671091 /ORGANISM="Coscinodiscus wailesii, Strain CCMP2513" /LENGTH=658 /DNA_ID=CAMNT_0013254141 /DNA_START=95 /DNA_END=2071 /DNA_ORIENTATION=+
MDRMELEREGVSPTTTQEVDGLFGMENVLQWMYNMAPAPGAVNNSIESNLSPASIAPRVYHNTLAPSTSTTTASNCCTEDETKNDDNFTLSVENPYDDATSSISNRQSNTESILSTKETSRQDTQDLDETKSSAKDTSQSPSFTEDKQKIDDAIDTSSEYIKSLLSSDYVPSYVELENETVAIPSSRKTNPTTTTTTTATNTPSRKRSRRNTFNTLSPHERQKAYRERNKYHARNTRLRKKAYIEELKRTLKDVTAERDDFVTDLKLKRETETMERSVRVQVMKEFLTLRGKNVRNVHDYLTILEDGFVMALPVTPFRDMVDGRWNKRHHLEETFIGKEKNESEQVLNGVSQVIEDVAFLHAFLKDQFEVDDETTEEKKKESSIQLVYESSDDDFFMNKCKAVLHWSCRATGIPGLFFQGSISAEFNPETNKMLSASLMFDTGAFLSLISKQKEIKPIVDAAPKWANNLRKETNERSARTDVDSAPKWANNLRKETNEKSARTDCKCKCERETVSDEQPSNNEHRTFAAQRILDHEEEKEGTERYAPAEEIVTNDDGTNAQKQISSRPQHRFLKNATVNVIGEITTSIQSSLSRKRQNPTTENLYQTIYGDVGTLLGSIDVFFPGGGLNNDAVASFSSNKRLKKTSTCISDDTFQMMG